MRAPRIHLAPGVPDLAALGARGFEDLMGWTGRLEGEPRAELLERARGATLLRAPLPGTPGPDGRRLGRPRGAGTGWIVLERFERAPLGELFRARFTAPRSSSLAARAWNLLCHLRAHGVSTPEPLALAELGDGPFARASVLVVRELERATPLPAWLASAAPERRRGAARALGHLLARIERAGVRLSGLRLADLSVAAPAVRPGAAGPLRGMRVSRAPEIAVTRVRGGGFGAAGPRARAAFLGRLARDARSLPGVGPRELLAVLHRALSAEMPRRGRRALGQRLARGLAADEPAAPAGSARPRPARRPRENA